MNLPELLRACITALTTGKLNIRRALSVFGSQPPAYEHSEPAGIPLNSSICAILRQLKPSSLCSLFSLCRIKPSFLTWLACRHYSAGERMSGGCDAFYGFVNTPNNAYFHSNQTQRKNIRFLGSAKFVSSIRVLHFQQEQLPSDCNQ